MNIKRYFEFEADWATLSLASQQGRLGEILQEGDIIPITLKNGEQHDIVATQDEHGKWHFVFCNCLSQTARMNDTWTNKGGWTACKMRGYLNNEVFSLLPDDLQAVIVPTKVVQIVDGKRVETEDKLWLPSESQIFGQTVWAGEEPEDTQLAWYKNTQNRVKTRDSNTVWYWERSAYAGSSGSFCFVTSDGNADYYTANYSAGVSPGFCLNED